MFKKSLFHEGEIAIQKRTRQANTANTNAHMISNKLPHGASHFIAQLQMVAIGSMDLKGRIWASIVFGKPGFFQEKNTQQLFFNMKKTGLLSNDPLMENIKNNTQVGLLFIDLNSRIRLRVNGEVQSLSRDGITVDVAQAYPNCPKYIQQRKVFVSDDTSDKQGEKSKKGTALAANQQALIQQADIFFVASAHPDYGIDCSHRGGQPDFVQVKNHQCLRIPDYVGNSFFNTLGNFQSYPFAGLVFIDFERQRLLQLTGQVKILWDLDDTDNMSGGTHRFWEFEIESWHESPIPFSVSWDYLGESPFNPSPFIFPPKKPLSLRIEKVTQLTPRIKSFVLSSTEQNNLPIFTPGAHLPITIMNKKGQTLTRQYSLISDYRDTTCYEIAVMEEPQGQGGSLALHNDVCVGDLLQGKTPINDFPMVDNAEHHSVLIAGGIGVTPIISMLRKLSIEKQSFEIHYAVRTHMDFALLDVIKELAGDKLHCYMSEEAGAKSLNLQDLLNAPNSNTHIYVCGPKGMIEAVRTISKATGWLAEQIHFESFGVKSLVEDKPISVYISQSKKTIEVPANQSILDSLLEAGIDTPYQCKRGECSMCMTTVLSGKPEHRDLCLSKEQKKSSMCICVSRAIGENLTLNL